MDTFSFRKNYILNKSIWKQDINDNSSWVLSLSDLMSLLLIFFLVWTTIKLTEIKEEKQTVPKVSIKERASKIKGLLMDFSPVEYSDNVMIMLDGQILFDSGSNSLSEEGRLLLYRLSRILKKNKRFNLRVIGHCDNLPLKKDSIWSSNLELSLARGSSVAAFLISTGIPANRIFVQGEGELYPTTKNSDETHRAFNRRVELIIEPF